VPTTGVHLLLIAAGAVLGAPEPGTVITVLGPVEPGELGVTLTHEHVLVDFIGAEKVSPDRFDRDEVHGVMLPYLRDLKDAGVDALVECTPNYLARDPALLRRLSGDSGVTILSNTGLYKEPFLPRWALEADAETIAAAWVREAVDGIEPDGIKPGFIKIAANEGPLNEMQCKIVRAAAIASRQTGLAIACHTTTAATVLEELDILAEESVPGERLIAVHADADPDLEVHARIVARGAWLSYDGIRAENAEKRLPLVKEALERWPEQLLISQDAGWYNVGEPGGGKIVPWSWLPRSFVPMLLGEGVPQTDIDRLLRTNAARAFTVRQAPR